jgi:hypothetical protein
MSNRVNLVSTKFVNVKENHETFGFRMYDDEGQEYDNTWKEIPENDLDVLAKVINESKNIQIMSMLDCIDENKEGIFVDSEWYDWEQIKHLFA